MPYLRLIIPDISYDLKKTLAHDLTQATLHALNLPEEARYRVTVHFTPFRLEDMAVGGELVLEHENPEYLLEFTDRDLTREHKEALVHELTSVLAHHLEVDGPTLYRINIIFHDYKPDDWAIGGRFISQMESEEVSGPRDTIVPGSDR